MPAIEPRPSFLRASALDAANASMRKAGRATWNDDDWNAGVDTLDSLIAACYGPLPEGYLAFQDAERAERSPH